MNIHICRRDKLPSKFIHLLFANIWNGVPIYLYYLKHLFRGINIHCKILQPQNFYPSLPIHYILAHFGPDWQGAYLVSIYLGHCLLVIAVLICIFYLIWYSTWVKSCSLAMFLCSDGNSLNMCLLYNHITRISKSHMKTID